MPWKKIWVRFFIKYINYSHIDILIDIKLFINAMGSQNNPKQIKTRKLNKIIFRINQQIILFDVNNEIISNICSIKYFYVRSFSCKLFN